MIHLFSMSGTHLIRASKQSLGIRMAVASHLGDVLGQAVDPESLDVALEAFYGQVDGTSVRTDDVDLIQIIGSSSTRVNDQLIWSKKSMPMVKILKMEILEEAPADKGVKDVWTIKVVIAGNTISLVDSGVEAFTMEEVDQSQTGGIGVSPGRRRKITVPEELLSSQRDILEHVQSPPGAGQGRGERIEDQEAKGQGRDEVTEDLGAEGQDHNPPTDSVTDRQIMAGGEGEPKTDRDSNPMLDLMEELKKLEVNPGAERSVNEYDVTMLSTQQTVLKAPISAGQGPFGDVLGSFRNRPDEFDVSRDLDATIESPSNQDNSDQQPSSGRSHAVTLVPSRLQTDGVPRRTVGPRDSAMGYHLSKTEVETTPEHKISAPMVQAAEPVPSRYYSLSETFGPVDWQRQMSDCVQSTAVKKQATASTKDVANVEAEQLSRFPQPVENHNEADKILSGTYGAQGLSNLANQPRNNTGRAEGNNGVYAQLLQPTFSGQPAQQVQSVQPIPHVQPSHQRQAIISSQSDDWLQYEKQKYLTPQMSKPRAKTAAPGYVPRLTPTPEDLPSSNRVNEPQVLMMKGVEPRSTGMGQSILRRDQSRSQGHMLDHPRQLQSPQGHMLDHQGQLQSPPGHMIGHQGQSQNYQDHMVGHQGRLPNLQGQTRRHQGWNSDHQGNAIERPGRPLDHQDHNKSLQDQSRNQALAQDLTVADLSKLVTEMARNTKPKEQQMRIQSSVQYPHFDPASEDDAEMAIASLSVLRDLGYNTAALVIGFCYQNSLSELLLALTPKQKNDFASFARVFRTWYGVNPATAQAQYDRLRQKTGENEIALYERISRLFRQVEGRAATEADNYKLGQKFIDSLNDEKTALQLRSKFLRDEYKSIPELIREAISMRQALETQKIRVENRKHELKALLQYIDNDSPSSPLVATNVHPIQGQKSSFQSNNVEQSFCKRCHMPGHVIEECTPAQDLHRFARFCSFHGWGYHDSGFCRSKMRPPMFPLPSRSKQQPTWADRLEQGVSCSRCGGPHEVTLCRANAKQVNNHNKVKNGSRPGYQELRFDVPAKYNSVPPQTVQNDKTLLNLDGDHWEVQYEDDQFLEDGWFGHQDEGFDWA